MLDNLGVWIGGGILTTVALPFVWSWAKRRVPPAIASFIGARMVAALKGEGVNDKDVRLFVQQLTYATVVLAEAKFPDKGMGKEKHKLVFDLLSNAVPFLSGFLKSQGTHLSEIIDKTVMEMDRTFKNMKEAHRDKTLVVPLPLTPHHRLKPDEEE